MGSRPADAGTSFDISLVDDRFTFNKHSAVNTYFHWEFDNDSKYDYFGTVPQP